MSGQERAAALSLARRSGQAPGREYQMINTGNLLSASVLKSAV